MTAPTRPAVAPRMLVALSATTPNAAQAMSQRPSRRAGRVRCGEAVMTAAAGTASCTAGYQAGGP